MYVGSAFEAICGNRTRDLLITSEPHYHSAKMANGSGRIRTFVAEWQQIYSLPSLTA